ncbi:MAG TPA: signal peptidase I [Clostridia bacterium]|nr:signal peptidase I [Clostridia bacterium]
MRNKLSKQKLKKLVKAAEDLHEKDAAYKRDADVQFYLYLAAVVILALSIRLFIFEPVRVDGDSMYDTLVNNEYMFTEKVTYWFREPERGEIITCFYPGYTISCVKRVIAIEGDTISIEGGQVYVNGEKIDESAYWNGLLLGDMDPVTVPEDCVFVMGDNRNDSKDSRAASVGVIPDYRIVGKCRAVIWPLSERRKV